MPVILLIALLIIGLLFAVVIFSIGIDTNQVIIGLFVSLLILAFIALGIYRVVVSHGAREQDEEHFFEIFEDNYDGIKTQCIRRGMNLENMNNRFGRVIEDNSFVRIYNFEEWKNGLWFAPRNYDYELIDPSHKRYEKVKKKFE